MKRRSLITILLVVVAAGVSMSQTDAESRLRRRVLRYHYLFERGQYGGMWDLSSQKLHDSNDNDKEEFVRYLRNHHLAKVRTRLLSLQLNGMVAKVKVEISLRDVKHQRWVSEKHEAIWVLENGDWYFDTYRMAERGSS